MPLSSIAEVAKKSVQDGSAVLSYKGAEYGLISEPESQGSISALLLPSDEGSTYKPVVTGVTKTLHLQELIRLPNISHDVGADDAGTQVGGTVNVGKPYEKAAPVQPEGLKMRYKPIGVVDSDESDSNVEPRISRKAPEFRIPKAPLSSQSPKKRKHQDFEDKDANGHPSPKKFAKVDATAEPVPTALTDLLVEQTPQKSKSWEDIEPNSTNSENRGIRSSGLSKRSKKPSSIEESPVRPQSTAPWKHNHPSLVVIDKSSPPAEETDERKQEISNRGSVPSKSKPPLAATAKELLSKTSPGTADKLADFRYESESCKPKKPRRRHKSIPANDDTTQDNNPKAHEEGPNTKVSVIEKKPLRLDHNQELVITREPIIEHSKKSKDSSRQSVAVELEKPQVSRKSKHEGETPDERKKRREEKKRRKEAKANATS